MTTRQATLEQQLLSVKKEMETRLSEMHSDEQLQELLQKARWEATQKQEKAVREAVERAEEKAAVDRQKALDGVQEKVRTAVHVRERELLAESGKALQELADTELKEANRIVKH